VRVVRGITANSAFAKKANKRAGEILAKRISDLRASVQGEANKIVRENYQTRSGPRRRDGGPHIVGSMVAKVDGKKFPLKIVLSSRAKREKVVYLNEGTVPHTITSQTLGGWLAIPRSNKRGSRPTKFYPSPFAARNARGGPPFKYKKIVNHPGNAPLHFLEDAMERAVRKVLNKAVTLKR